MARVDERIVERHEREQTGAAEQYTRRRILRAGFFGTMGLFIAAFALQVWNFCWPRGLSGFGGIFTVSADRVPQPGGEPERVVEGKFWLVNLRPDEGPHGTFGEQGQGGLLALYQKCPHLGCTVPWRGTFNFEGKEGWFRCPCHGSTYTKGGIRVFGPAPRPLDTMAISVQGNGAVQVNTGEITLGAPDNPRRAVPYNRT
jgi:cytochrome b6-f complex iron-sulfur subunit